MLAVRSLPMWLKSPTESPTALAGPSPPTDRVATAVSLVMAEGDVWVVGRHERGRTTGCLGTSPPRSHRPTRRHPHRPTPVAAAGQRIHGLALDIDATIVICHSEKESATRAWKKTLSFPPLLRSLDDTGEALSGLRRKGRAGSADHITALNHGLARSPRALARHLDPGARSDPAVPAQSVASPAQAIAERINLRRRSTAPGRGS